MLFRSRPLQLCADGGYQLRLEVLVVPLFTVPDKEKEEIWTYLIHFKDGMVLSAFVWVAIVKFDVVLYIGA